MNVDTIWIIDGDRLLFVDKRYLVGEISGNEAFYVLSNGFFECYQEYLYDKGRVRFVDYPSVSDVISMRKSRGISILHAI